MRRPEHSGDDSDDSDDRTPDGPPPDWIRHGLNYDPRPGRPSRPGPPMSPPSAPRGGLNNSRLLGALVVIALTGLVLLVILLFVA